MRNNVNKRLEAAARALAKNPKVVIKMRGNEIPPELNENPVITLPATEAENLSFLRGEADLAALSLRYHIPKIHYSLRPAAFNSALVFDALERTRIEILGSEHWQGVKANLIQRAQNRLRHKNRSQGEELGDALSLLLREKVLGVKPPQNKAPLVELWRKHLDGKLEEMLSGLVGHLSNQKEYAQTVNHILKVLDLAVRQQNKEEKPQENPDSEETDQNTAKADEDRQEETEAETVAGTGGSERSIAGMASDDYEPPEDAPVMEYDLPSYPANAPMNDFDALLHSNTYRAFTTQFDELIDADKLASHEEILRLRFQLDQKLINLHSITSKLAARLQRVLFAKQARTFEYGLEEGIIDNKRLANVIVNPDYEYFYKREKETDFRDTVVTLLIDNSGSMRGRPITVAALCADILARTLERCGVKVEILGFTTRDWKGGQSRKLWLERDRPLNPGRLNDLRHIVYKSADTRWQKARRNIGLMLKDGILKENIDGEAIIWAHGRLLARPEQRRILMVISDGAPVDDSTLSSNNGGYLDQHLLQVIHAIENNSDVELLAIGIGHDVTRYYKRAVTISDVSQLGDVMAKELAKLFS
jgi:cobaltochelatase CobT